MNIVLKCKDDAGFFRAMINPSLISFAEEITDKKGWSSIIYNPSPKSEPILLDVNCDINKLNLMCNGFLLQSN